MDIQENLKNQSDAMTDASLPLEILYMICAELDPRVTRLVCKAFYYFFTFGHLRINLWYMQQFLPSMAQKLTIICDQLDGFNNDNRQKFSFKSLRNVSSVTELNIYHPIPFPSGFRLSDHLPNLSSLVINQTVTDFELISGLTKLTRLEIGAVSSQKKIDLNRLQDLRHLHIRNYSNVVFKMDLLSNLEFLSVNGTLEANFANLSKLTYFDANNVVKVLETNPNSKMYYYSPKPICEYISQSDIEHLTSLTFLSLKVNHQILDLSRSTKLVELELYDCKLDGPGLTGLTSLTKLSLEGCHQISTLPNLPSLTQLCISEYEYWEEDHDSLIQSIPATVKITRVESESPDYD